MSAIVIDDLMKRVGKQRVFSNLNLEVLEGEFFTLLGLKDAGKTTLTRILMGYLKANKGSARIYDMDCNRESKEIKESVTFVPEEVLLQDNLKAINIFRKTLAAHNLRSTEDIDTLCDYFNFNSRMKIGDMDENESKIFSIINALIVKPRLLILDEPIKGLNPDSRVKLFDYLKNLNRSENLTIFMLTDSLIEAKKYSKRIAYLHNGIIKNVEFVNEKPANDKILRINNYRGNLNHFTSIGAHLIKDEPEETILYYDQDLRNLSKVICEENLESYSLENANLEDKINAYYSDDKTYITKEQIHKKEVPSPIVSDTLEATEVNGVIVEEQTEEITSPVSKEVDTADEVLTQTQTAMEKAVIDTKPSEVNAVLDNKISETSGYEPINDLKEDTKDETIVIETTIPEEEEEVL